MSKLRYKTFATVKRSLVKSIVYRILNIIVDTIVIFAITHRYDQTAILVILSNITSTILYFVHERFWNQIHWGKYNK